MSMVQAFSYNFSTVENPLSDSGNFVTINNGVFTGGTLKTVSGNLCEPTATSTWGCSLYDGTVAAPGGVLPNDQYAEITLATWTQNYHSEPILPVCSSGCIERELLRMAHL